MTPLCNSWYTQNIAFMGNENIYMAVPGFNSAAVFWVRNSELTPSENSFPDIPLDSATRESVNRTVLYKPLVPWHFAVRTSLGRLGYNTSDTLLRTICEAGEFMLTPWKGIAFRITGHLRGESTGDRRIFLTKERQCKALVRLPCCEPEKLLNKDSMSTWFATPWRACDVTVLYMYRFCQRP